MRAVSDANSVPGGDGGRGGYAPQVAGEDGSAGTTGGGGGGGGGAAGRIRLYEIFSPPPLISNAEVSPNPIFD